MQRDEDNRLGGGRRMRRRYVPVNPLAALLISACTSAPEGPTVLVLNGGTKTFQQFAQDDTLCRRFASLEARGTPPDQAVRASGLAPPGATPASLATSGTDARQQLYDIAYAQCMDDRGHRIPVPGLLPDELPEASWLPPPPTLPDETR